MYLARVLSKDEQNNSKIGIFFVGNESEEQIGEYERSSYTRDSTFYPFQKNGQDFALYSPHYSEIKILELPSCKDIGGVETEKDDFCAIDFYVPSYMEQQITSRTTSSEGKIEEKTWTVRVSEPKDEKLFKYVKSHPYENVKTGEKGISETIYRPLTSRLYYPFGFVHGCYWMDDYTVHFLDLSKVEEGIIKREARFGYIEIPNNLSLKEAVDMESYEKYPDNRVNYFQMRIMQTFDLETGEKINPYE